MTISTPRIRGTFKAFFAYTFVEHRDMRNKQVSAGTVIRELGLLRAIFETARNEWDIPLHENPLVKVRKPRQPESRTRRLEDDELETLIKVNLKCQDDWLTKCILLAIETGMRRGELLNVRKCDLDFKARVLKIPHTKNGFTRTIPLSSTSLSIFKARLKQLCSDNQRLFEITGNAFRLAWERCKQRAAKKIPTILELRFHDLRHEAISRLFELGLSVPEVALISGHRDPRMLFKYTHLKPENIADKLG